MPLCILILTKIDYVRTNLFGGKGSYVIIVRFIHQKVELGSNQNPGATRTMLPVYYHRTEERFA
jgi:hypothetical protein